MYKYAHKYISAHIYTYIGMQFTNKIHSMFYFCYNLYIAIVIIIYQVAVFFVLIFKTESVFKLCFHICIRDLLTMSLFVLPFYITFSCGKH